MAVPEDGRTMDVAVLVFTSEIGVGTSFDGSSAHAVPIWQVLRTSLTQCCCQSNGLFACAGALTMDLCMASRGNIASELSRKNCFAWCNSVTAFNSFIGGATH